MQLNRKTIPMLSAATILIACTAIMLAAHFNVRFPWDIVHPPNRTARNVKSRESLLKPKEPVTFAKIIKKADLIARVRIGNWIGETEYMTFFQAEIIEVYKGKKHCSITIVQNGSSTYGVDGLLLDYGQELLLFMSSVDTPLEGTVIEDHKNVYYLTQKNLSVYDVAKWGLRTYVVDRYAIIAPSIQGVENYASYYRIRYWLRNILETRDPLRAEYSYEFGNYSNIFSLNDIEVQIKRLVKEQKK